MNLKKLYLGAYLIAPTITLAYELSRPKEKRSKSRIILGCGLATTSLLLRGGIILGAYETLPEKSQIILDEKIKNKKTIEKKIYLNEKFPVDSTYIYGGVETNRKVYKE